MANPPLRSGPGFPRFRCRSKLLQTTLPMMNKKYICKSSPAAPFQSFSRKNVPNFYNAYKIACQLWEPLKIAIFRGIFENALTQMPECCLINLRLIRKLVDKNDIFYRTKKYFAFLFTAESRYNVFSKTNRTGTFF